MNDMLIAIIHKLDRLQEDVTDIKVIQAEQGKDISTNTKDLTIHIKRTNLLEERMDQHEKDDDAYHEKTDKSIADIVKPISLSSFVKRAVAVIGALSAICSAGYGVWIYVIKEYLVK